MTGHMEIIWQNKTIFLSHDRLSDLAPIYGSDNHNMSSKGSGEVYLGCGLGGFGGGGGLLGGRGCGVKKRDKRKNGVRGGL